MKLSDNLSALPNKISDEKLVFELAQGSIEALEMLMRKYEAQIYHFALKLLKSPDFATEVSQDVFLTLWEKREQLQHIDSLSSWLFKLSKNRALNILQRGQIRSAKEHIYAEMSTTTVHSEHNIYEKELQKLINEAIDLLPAKRRSICKLKIEKGLTNEEIATLLQISSNTVKNQLTKSYSSIKQKIATYLHVSLLYFIFQC